MKNISQEQIESAPLIAVAAFARQLGRSTCTLWRWQKKGMIDKPVNIAGKPYFTRDAIDRFVRRALAGEFEKKPHVPMRSKGGT